MCMFGHRFHMMRATPRHTHSVSTSHPVRTSDRMPAGVQHGRGVASWQAPRSSRYTEAMPPLTTIQDMLYDATGAPLQGTLTITSIAGLDPEGDLIAASVITLDIIDGNLTAVLVPNMTGIPHVPTMAPYTATMESAGECVSTNYWMVPPSVVPLTVADVAQPIPQP